MWKYEKKLEYPINITKRDLKLAKAMLSQYGGPSSELSASLQYINQRYSMPDEKGYALLTDIGTEAPEMFLSGANAFFDAFATV